MVKISVVICNMQPGKRRFGVQPLCSRVGRRRWCMGRLAGVEACNR